MERVSPATDDRVLVGYGTSDDAGVYLLRDDLAARPDGRFFYADRRRPIRLRTNRCNQRTLGRLRDGREPAHRAQHRRLPRRPRPGDSSAHTGWRSDRRRAVPASQSWAATRLRMPSRNTGWRLPACRSGRIVTNAGARPGDLLVLTKPLGTGILTTALKRGAIAAEALDEAVRWMTALTMGLRKQCSPPARCSHRHHRIRVARPRRRQWLARRTSDCRSHRRPCAVYGPRFSTLSKGRRSGRNASQRSDARVFYRVRSFGASRRCASGSPMRRRPADC